MPVNKLPETHPNPTSMLGNNPTKNFPTVSLLVHYKTRNLLPFGHLLLPLILLSFQGKEPSHCIPQIPHGGEYYFFRK
jgi:hypothetical protein